MEQKQKTGIAARLPQVQKLETELSERFGDAADGLRDANRRFVAYVKQRPGTCLVGALAVGYLLGRVLRSRG